MNIFWNGVRGIGDLFWLTLRHPAWFIRTLAKQVLEIRALGTAKFRNDLIYTYHHNLDQQFRQLPVEIGGCPVEYSKAMIVGRFCRLLRPKKVLEIGTFLGGMTYHIARNTDDDCRIWTIDLPREKLPEISGLMIRTDVALAQTPESAVGEFWRKTPESAKITQLWGDSLGYDFSPLGQFDLIYVDGSHAEPWVQKDTENAFRLLKPTGAILWDDCYWHDVQKVLGRYAKSKPIYCFEDGNTAGYLQVAGQPVSFAPRLQ